MLLSPVQHGTRTARVTIESVTLPGNFRDTECASRLDMLTPNAFRYLGWFHKLHAEPGDDRITFANDVANWIIKRTQAAPKPQSKL